MEDCIKHPLRSRSVEVHGDYLLLLDGDAIAAAILGVFESWSQVEMVRDTALQGNHTIWVGRRRIVEFERKLCGFASEQQIRIRIKKLEEHGLIQSEGDGNNGATKAYCFYRGEIQKRIDELLNGWEKEEE